MSALTLFFSRQIPTVVVSLVACGYLSSCAPQSPPTKESVAAKTVFKKNPYTLASTIDGPFVGWYFANGKFTTDNNTISTLRWRLSIIDNKNASLIVHTRALKWMFLQSAYALNKGELSVPVSPKRDIEDTGMVAEAIMVDIPIQMLKSHSQSGLSLQLVGSRGSVSFTIPAYYIQGFLEAAKK